jgi:hypothetical protein
MKNGVNNLLVAQGRGFIRRYLEMDVEQQKPGANDALEWFDIIEQGMLSYQEETKDIQAKLRNIKIMLG